MFQTSQRGKLILSPTWKRVAFILFLGVSKYMEVVEDHDRRNHNDKNGPYPLVNVYTTM